MRSLDKRKQDKHSPTPFFEPKIQKKLKTGNPGDHFEAEADKVADHVTNKRSAGGGLLQSKEIVQKKPEEKEETVQKKTEEKEEAVQKKTNEGLIQKKEEKDPTSNVERNLKKGGGNPLDSAVRLEMENSFEVDFSPIRIHTDDNAVKMCQEIGAQAFTNGADIYFNKGKYDPNSVQGKKLLAHELTHTIQQGAIFQKKK